MLENYSRYKHMKLGKSVRVRERAFFGRTPLQCNFHRNAHAMLDSVETADVGIFSFNAKLYRRISQNLL